MKNLRPDWTTPRYNDTKINLSNNICYDKYLHEQVDQLFNSTKFDVRQYPDEYIVYKALSTYHNIPAKNIAVGLGIGELISRILNQTSSIYIISPTWPMVEILSEVLNVNYSTTDPNQDCVYVANPNGVSGTYLTREEILELTKKYKTVIVDEAYCDFCTEDISVLSQSVTADNLIVLKTFSKSLSLAGLRFGYATSNLDTINKLQLTRPGSIMHGSIVSLIHSLLKLIPSHVSRMIETRTYIENRYDCIPSQGNFVLLKTLPKELENNFIIKKTNGSYRMALTNLEILKRAIGY